MELATQWLALDRHEETRQEIQRLVDAKDEATLRSLLSKRMSFGTAGLRASMGAGYCRMNVLTIIQTTQGLVSYIETSFPNGEGQKRGVCVGFDGRHNSLIFALHTAATFLCKGIRVHLFSSICPTPFVPFAVTHYGCVAGIMITASHNPKEDNGYKVYWSNGSQIIPPHDEGIANAIETCLTPWEGSWDITSVASSPLVTDPMEEVKTNYYRSIVAVNYHSSLNTSNASCEKRIRFAYTAMHGVGFPFTSQAMSAFGHSNLIPVLEQIQPDPNFPTVTFPNPEEGKGALALSIATADRQGCQFILANDPDADRLAVAEKLDSGNWHIFSGNEIGSLLGWWMLHSYTTKYPKADAKKLVVLASTVSSKMLRAIAHKFGAQFEETLTGFKWMGNRAHERIAAGETVLFAYEEAIGFMCGSAVLDKDGVSAAAIFAEMTVWLASKAGGGESPYSWLMKMYIEYGYFVTNNSYYICRKSEKITAMFDHIRKMGPNGGYPTRIGNIDIIHIRDLTTGYDSEQPDCKARLPTSASSQMITFTFENGCIATLRTSGTEPKIKYYAEMKGKAATKDERTAVSRELDATVETIVEYFYRPKEMGFQARPTS